MKKCSRKKNCSKSDRFVVDVSFENYVGKNESPPAVIFKLFLTFGIPRLWINFH